MLEAELRILDSVKGPVEDFIEAHLHLGTAAVLARVAMLEATEMRAGQSQMVQLRLAEPLPLAPGERFVLRANLAGQGQSGLVTIGGGRVLGASNVRLRRKKQWTIEAMASRREVLDDPAGWCELMVRESRQPLNTLDLRQKCLLRPEEMAPLLESLQAKGRILRTPAGSFAHPAVVAAAADRMLAAIVSFHAANPQRAGMAREESFSTAGENVEICELASAALVAAGKLERQGAVFARTGWKARLSNPDQELTERIAAAFQKAGWAGPPPAELAASLGQPPERVIKLTQLLAERGVLIRLDQQILIHRDALASAKQVVLRLFTQKPSFTTMEFRDALAVSRKYAVPLLDYLDKIRFTVRSRHDRTPGVEAKKLLQP
jgi:selenocysteine-specific elongation factor